MSQHGRKILVNDTTMTKLIHTEYKADTGNSTDDNVAEVLQDSEEDLLIPEAKEHYDNLSDSHQSPIDEDEEEKMEQEILTRLSHLKINRTPNRYRLDNIDRDKSLDWNTAMHDDDDYIEQDNIHNHDPLNSDDDDDADNIPINVGDEHYQSLYETNIMNTINSTYSFNIKKEFLSNETFLKYAMLYATIYLVSKYCARRLYHNTPMKVDAISRKAILICNATITIFKNHAIWNQPHRAIVSPLRDILSENEINFMDIQKAFHCVMLVLSYFGGKSVSKSRLLTRKLSRFYNLICIGCIILIKKYRKYGGLYIYTSFWMQLSSFFLYSSKVLKQFALFTNGGTGRYATLMRHSGVSSAVMYALTMIYSRVYLFSKIFVPIIQHYYRNNNRVIGSCGSFAFIGFLVSGYYQIGDGFINAFIKK